MPYRVLPNKAELQSQARTLYAQGESKRGIARQLGINHKTVHRWLRPTDVSPSEVRAVQVTTEGDDTPEGGLAITYTAAQQMLQLAAETKDERLRLAALESAAELGLAIDAARSRVKLIDVLAEAA